MTSHVRHILTATLCAIAGAAPALAQAQDPATISGRVVTEAGTPVTAVSVSIPSLQVGGYTNEDGRYTFTVPASKATGQVIMTARRVGYEPKSVTITLSAGAKIEQQFTIVASVTQLEGIVVTGLGQEKEKSQLGTAQQQVTAEQLTQAHTPNFVNALGGKVSGVNITDGGTQGGSTRVLIRGASSIDGANQPLYVVDGIPVYADNRGGSANGGARSRDYGNTISDLNANDIASVTVLKGPNAAAIYGSSAAAGVIIITTKKGEATGNKIRTNWNSSVTWDKIAKLPDFQNEYGQGTDGAFQWGKGANCINCEDDQSWGPKLDGRTTGCVYKIDPATNKPIIGDYDTSKPCVQFTGEGAWVAHPNNVRSFFNTGLTMDHSMSVTGGTDRANARMSAGSQSVDGMLPNSSWNKVTSAIAGQLRVGDKLTLSTNLQYIRNQGKNRPLTGYTNGSLQQFFWYGRQVDIDVLRGKYYNEDGSLWNWNSKYHNNPFLMQYASSQKDERNNILANATADYALTDWLSANFQIGMNTYRLGNTQNFARGTIGQTNLAYNGSFNVADDFRSQNTTQFLLNANKALTSRLGVTGMVGTSRRYREAQTSATNVAGITVEHVYTVTNAATAPTLSLSRDRQQVNSVFGTASFTWDNWWTVEGTARNDWSSTLPKGKNSYFYPSVATSVVLTNAIPSLRSNTLSYLKIRGSVARVGADANPYRLDQTFNGSSNKFGSLPLFSSSTTIANADLKPEITKANEAGVEVGFFDNRITVDATWYHKATINQILNVTLPPSAGFSAKTINAGKITNTGYEALLTVIPVRTQSGFEWTSSFNYSSNKSKVVELYGDLQTVVFAGFFSGNIEARLGGPMGVIYGNSFERDSATGLPLTKNGKPYFVSSGRKVLGKVEPDWVGGWNNDFRYKRITAGFLIDIHKGGNIYSATNMVGNYSGVLKESLQGREVDWNAPGLVYKGIDATTGAPNTVNVTAASIWGDALWAMTERWVYDASYVKLREVRVGMDLPESITSRLHVSGANLAVIGRNLWLNSNVPNIDPEVVYSTSNAQGYEYAPLPHPRSIGFNVRVTP